MVAASEASSSAPARVSLVNPANAVTAARYLTLPPLYWAVAHGYHQWATIFILICGLFDKLDGLVARIFHCKSAFGEVFDAITDAACYGFGLILVAAFGWAPVLPVVAMIAMGGINVVMRLAYAKRAGRTTNYKSYAMERTVAYTGYLIGFATGGMAVHFYFWAYVPLMAAILVHDARRMLVDPIPPAPVAGAEVH